MKLSAGIKVGRLTLNRVSSLKEYPCGKRHSIWECSCDCGKTTFVDRGNLSNKHTLSCGCLQDQRRSESHTKHGHCKGPKWTPLYRVWRGMIQRCNDPGSSNYERYGARGIRVGWRCFEDFVRDMESGWRKGLTIERNDNNGSYCKSNCRWATYKEQAINKRNNVWLEHGGKRMTLSQWADSLGIKRMTLKRRLNLGWSVENSLTEEIK